MFLQGFSRSFVFVYIFTKFFYTIQNPIKDVCVVSSYPCPESENFSHDFLTVYNEEKNGGLVNFR